MVSLSNHEGETRVSVETVAITEAMKKAKR
jgi:hypothetical protein